MLHIVQGNLLESDCNIIAHQSNCMMTMGSGVAKQIKDKWPDAYRADLSFPASKGKDRLGMFSSAKVGDSKWVANLYGQLYYGRNGMYTNYDALRSAIDNLLFHSVAAFGKEIKIGFPYGMGAGLAGGDWGTIYNILLELSNIHKMDLYLYRL